MKKGIENQKNLPAVLYRDDLLRSAKAIKQLSIEQIVAEAKQNGSKIAYGTVQSILKGAKSIELSSLWIISSVLDVPMDSLFRFPAPLDTDLTNEQLAKHAARVEV